jgi:uncharacterized RDD family membrane protein YckC
VAFVVDALLIGVLIFAITTILGRESASTCTTTGGIVPPQGFVTNNSYVCTSSSSYLVNFFVSIVYFVICWSTGATLGQRALGLRVVNATTGQTISLGQSIVRYFGFIISALVFYIGLIWAAGDNRKQGWHDKMAGTFVIYKVANQNSPPYAF